MAADFVFYNGNILSCDEKFNIFSSLAVKGDSIVKTGTKRDIDSMISNHTVCVDLKGRTLLPGFIDSHVHFTQTGVDAMNLDVGIFSNLTDLYEALEKYAEDIPASEWVIANGLNEENMEEKKLPSRWDLDGLDIDNPIFISRIDSHSSIVNSKGYKILDIDDDLEGIVRDCRGVTAGIFRAEANELARNKMADMNSDEKRKRAVHRASQLALEAGVTFINVLEGGGGLFNDRDVEVLVRERENLPLNIKIFHQTMDVEKVIKNGFQQIGGCITLDGSVGSHTAAFFEPYNDDQSTKGSLYYSDEKVEAFVEEAHRKNLQITTHCIGDLAIEQMLKAYEQSLRNYPRQDHRHRIEHFSIPTLKQIKRVARLNLIISVQPVFDYYDQDNMYLSRLGVERAKRAFPLKTMIENGILLAGGSDSPITPIAPLLGIYAAVNHSNKAERISAEEAIKLFTINGARAAFCEGERGSLEAGKRADLVLLEKNPLDVAVEEIKNINVEMTMVDGRIQYGKEL